ncbi:hypothetical protein FOL47_009213, partial [Perkinsus chesapeaki]
WSNVIGEEPDIDEDIDELEAFHEACPAIVNNIRILSPPAPRFTHNVDDDYKDQRLEEFTKFYLQRYHVVCLQEMFGAFSGRRKRLISRARRMGFRWKVTSPQRRSSGFLVDGGCIILSRLRIVRSRATVYQPGVFSDQLAAKDKAGEVAARVRQSQIDELINFIKKCTSEEDITTEGDTTGIIDDTINQSRPPPPRRPKMNSYGSSAASTTDSPINRPPLQEVIGKVSYNHDDSESLHSPSLERSSIPIRIRKYPIILVGDFNCNARTGPHDSVDDSDEYKLIKSKLEDIGVTEDVLFQQLGEHPVTYASADFHVTSRSSTTGALEYNGGFVPSERALTDPVDWSGHGEQTNQSLDYIFYFPPPAPSHHIIDRDDKDDDDQTTARRGMAAAAAAAGVSVKSAQVNSFHLTQRRGVVGGGRLYSHVSQPSHDPLQEFAFTQLSDHYGVEVELSISNEEDGMKSSSSSSSSLLL